MFSPPRYRRRWSLPVNWGGTAEHEDKWMLTDAAASSEIMLVNQVSAKLARREFPMNMGQARW